MKKFEKIASLVTGGMFLLTTACFAVSGTVNAPNGLILREKASSSGKVIKTISDNEEVEILEKDGDWYKVKYNNDEGYVFAEYVNAEEEVEEAKEQKEEKDNTTENKKEETAVAEKNSNNKKAKSNFKIYIMPSVTSKTIGSIEKDQTVTVNYELNNWVNISAGDIQGWARKYFLDIDENKQEDKKEETDNSNTENANNEEQPDKETTTAENNEKKDESESKEDEKQDTNTTYKEEKTGYINASVSANVRKSASTSSDIVTILTKNTQVKILGEEGDFYKIQFQDYTGYIAKYLISDKAV